MVIALRQIWLYKVVLGVCHGQSVSNYYRSPFTKHNLSSDQADRSSKSSPSRLLSNALHMTISKDFKKVIIYSYVKKLDIYCTCLVYQNYFELKNYNLADLSVGKQPSLLNSNQDLSTCNQPPSAVSFFSKLIISWAKDGQSFRCMDIINQWYIGSQHSFPTLKSCLYDGECSDIEQINTFKLSIKLWKISHP